MGIAASAAPPRNDSNFRIALLDNSPAAITNSDTARGRLRPSSSVSWVAAGPGIAL